ncbi:MAG: hypothetical protein CMJ83_21565 [Planctomycetes bacterium]|nr:hypothetical protein [Planctomycetota bacterium]
MTANAATGLSARLQRLGLLRAGPRTLAPQPRVEVSRDVPGVVEVEEGQGSFVLRTCRHPLDYVHGARPLGDALAVSARDVGLATRRLDYAEVPPDRRLYLDTETTSLSGGAGVYVFLVGLGRFEDDAFVVRQYFMRDPGDEGPMLAAVARQLDEADALVSFCGRSFDVPRLADRFVFHDRDVTARRLRTLRHVDLYHGGRALFGSRLPDGRLRTYERRMLDVHRVDDLAGAECPEAWFGYVRGDENRIAKIMEHNLIDVLSLVGLEERIGRAFVAPDHPLTALATGVLAFESGGKTRAACHLVPAARRVALDGAAPFPLLLRAVRALRRLDETAAAVTLLGEMVTAVPHDTRGWVQLAIVQEHTLRDHPAALASVDAALGVTSAGGNAIAALRHRRRRLERRLASGSAGLHTV